MSDAEKLEMADGSYSIPGNQLLETLVLSLSQ